MRVVSFLEVFAFRTWFPLFGISVLIIAAAKSGFWYIPNIETSRAVALNPFVNPLPEPKHYLFLNWFGPFLAWSIGATGPWSFVCFHFGFSISFLTLLVMALRRRLPDWHGRAALAIFVALPVSMTHVYWVGLDAITLLLALLALLSHRRLPIAFTFGIALGMQHFEQALLAFVALIAALILSRAIGDRIDHRLDGTIAVAVGILGGKLALVGIFAWNDIVVLSGRADYIERDIERLVALVALNPGTTLFATFGAAWLVLIRYLDRGRQSLPFVIPVFGLLGLMPFIYDNTRVFAVTSFPLVVVYWLWNRDWLATITNREIAILLLVWLVTPWLWVWEGKPQLSVLPYNLALALKWTLNWPDVLMHRELWPFSVSP